MTNKNPEQDEVFSTKDETKTLSDTEEQELLRTAIPMPTPELTDEELEELRQLELKKVDELEPESKNESKIGLLGTPSEADINVSPYKYGGKLYFTASDGVNYTCSAQFVGEYNILLTAAHCVRDHISGTFFSNFRFYRAYDNGSYGRMFTTNVSGTKAGWVNETSARRRYDYAFLRTTVNSDVGYMGYKTLQNENNWTAFGYPQNYGNNQIMYKVDGTRGEVTGGTVEMLGNPMRSGNSGGARFIAASPNNRQALGNDAFHRTGNTTDEWGPVFNNSTFTLLRAVRDF